MLPTFRILALPVGILIPLKVTAPVPARLMPCTVSLCMETVGVALVSEALIPANQPVADVDDTEILDILLLRMYEFEVDADEILMP